MSYQANLPKPPRARRGCISTILKVGGGALGMLVLIIVVASIASRNSGTHTTRTPATGTPAKNVAAIASAKTLTPTVTLTPLLTDTVALTNTLDPTPTSIGTPLGAPVSTNTSLPTNTPLPTNTSLPTATPVPTDTPTPLPPAPSFNEIRAQMEVMTRVQWDAYQKSLEGRKVQAWTGWVIDVKSKMLSGYRLTVDMDDSNQDTNGVDISFDISEDIALMLSKGSPVKFSGEIRSALNIIGSLQVGLINVTVEPPPPTSTPMDTPLPTSTPLATNTPTPPPLAISGTTGIDELGISYRMTAPEGIILQEWSAEERENGDLVYDFIISTPGKKFASDVSVTVDYYDEDDKEIGHAKTLFLGSETAQDRERIYDGRMSCDWGSCPNVLTKASYYVIEFEVDLIDFP